MAQSRSGEGFLVEFAYAGPTLYFFGSVYSYDPAGNLLWLTFQPTAGAVPDSGTSIEVTVSLTSGGTWGNDHNPDLVENVVFGTAVFTFDTCTAGSVSIMPAQAYLDAGFTNVAYPTSRLLQAGVACPTFENNTETPVASN